MKKILFVVFAFVLLASCAENDVTPILNDNQKIAFQAVVGKTATKEIIDELVYPTDVAFGSAAFMHNGEWPATAATAGLYIKKSPVKYFETYWSTADSESGNEVKYYWPIDGVYLTFFSFSPWAELCSDEITTIDNENGITIKNWDVHANQTVDIMVADVAKGQTANTAANTASNTSEWNGVPTIFRHKLSQVVKFEINTEDDYIAAEDNVNGDPAVGDMRVYINSIKIKNVCTKGTYKSGLDMTGVDGGTWEQSVNNVQDYELVTTSAANPNEIFYNETSFTVENNSNKYLLVLPQTFSSNTGDNGAVGDEDPQIEVVYTVRQYYNAGTEEGEEVGFKEKEVTKYVSLHDIHSEDHKWEMNKRITYKLTINLRGNKEIRWSPKVEIWNDVTYTDGGYIIE